VSDKCGIDAELDQLDKIRLEDQLRLSQLNKTAMKNE